MQTTTLYNQEGSSDKVYTATLQPEGSGYHVAFAYGRRNSTLQTGMKTSQPLPLAEAQAIYDKLLHEKQSKGYRPGEVGAAYVVPATSRQSTGILPQLLNPVENCAVDRLIKDPAYWMQEKLDGRRMLLRKEGDQITGINRLGLVTAPPQSVVAAALRLPQDFVLDGEAVGDHLHVFDILQLNDEDWRPMAFGKRMLKAMQLLSDYKSPHLLFVPTAFLSQQKQRAFEDLQAQHKEGVVFKHVDGVYTPGRPASGGAQLKFKFYETASFIVNKVNDRRSVALMLFHGDKIKLAGNVTIPPNHDVPVPGQVVECRYLYAFRESGAIYQPVYLGARDDIRASECRTCQLKYKPEKEDLETVAASIF